MGWSRFFRRRRWDEERARELESHLQLETDENMARGMGPDAARRAAERKLGDVLRIREEIYLMNTVGLLDTLGQDLRYGARVLANNRGFALVAILSLALGIGANTAVFQLLNALRLRTLPIEDPSRLVEVRIKDQKGFVGRATGRYPRVSNVVWERIRDRAQGFSGLGAWGTNRFDLASGGEVRYAEGMWVSGGFFATLGVGAAAGRLIGPEDDVPGCASPGVVVSHAFWQRALGGDPRAIGQILHVDGHPLPIIGVTARGFFGVEVGRSFDVAVPLCVQPLIDGTRDAAERPDWWFLAVLGRLAPGWSAERATAQLASVSPSIFEETVPPRYGPDDAREYRAFSLAAYPSATGFSRLRRDYEKPLWLLLGLTTLVLLTACANLANLFLARASAREREIAVRMAIGASRRRIVRQLMAESLLVAALGAAAGALLSRWLSAALVRFLATKNNPVFVDLRPDLRLLLFTAAVAIVTCLLFGLAPALRATRVAPGAALKSSGRGLTTSRQRLWLRQALVVCQVSLSLVLVVTALLFVATLRNLMNVDPGFRTDDVLAVTLDYRRAPLPKGAEVAAKKEAVDGLRRLPGVLGAAQADIVPVSGSGWNQVVLVGGVPQAGRYPNFNRVSPGYFDTLGIRFVAGRDFGDDDTATSPPVAIVNESFAKAFLPGRDPLRETFQIEEPPGAPRPQYQIVGVVADTKYFDMREKFPPLIYLAAAQETQPDAFLQVVVRTIGDPQAMAPAVARWATARNPFISVSFESMRSQVRRTVQTEALMATLTGSFGLLAGIIAALGLYGVMSYLVARRRQEIGIRMALGADRWAVVRMILREAAALLAIGLGIGAVLALAGGRAAGALLFGLTPSDPATLAKAVLALAITAAVASYVPAMRAARVDPVRSLRED
jgi:predicted permease